MADNAARRPKTAARPPAPLAASANTGVDATTGKGLAEALAGAQVVVDLLNSPSFETAAALAFFESSGRNLARAELATAQQPDVVVM